MKISTIQGLSRRGWFFSFALAAFIVMASYENTKEFCASICRVINTGDWGQSNVGIAEIDYEQVNESSALGFMGFSQKAPKEIVDNVHRTRLGGLIAGLILTFTLVIQGSILLFAWIVKAFKPAPAGAQAENSDKKSRESPRS